MLFKPALLSHSMNGKGRFSIERPSIMISDQGRQLIHQQRHGEIVANQFLEIDLEKLKAAVSLGHARAVGKPKDLAVCLRPDQSIVIGLHDS
jgi:hypothetical protein